MVLDLVERADLGYQGLPSKSPLPESVDGDTPRAVLRNGQPRAGVLHRIGRRVLRCVPVGNYLEKGRGQME